MTDTRIPTDAVVGEQLAALVTRIERLEAEIDGLNADKREVYAEAKACGFCKKTLRKLVMRRKKDRDELLEEDELLDLYEHAVATAQQKKDPFD